MQKTKIEQLFIYPVKSLAGVQVSSIKFSSSGPVDDRRYMLVDQNNRFLTQRSHAILSQFQLTKVASGWQVFSPDGDSIVIQSQDSTERTLQTKVWKTEISVREKSKLVSSWFSNHLDELVRLVEFEDLESRFSNVNGHQVPLAFADGYPLLICNDQSLAWLSEQVGCALSISRFRPNVVISLASNDEYKLVSLASDTHASIQIAEPCVRCNIPAIEPKTSVYQKELHQKMKRALMQNNKVIFGVNAAAVNVCVLRVGDEFTPNY